MDQVKVESLARQDLRAVGRGRRRPAVGRAFGTRCAARAEAAFCLGTRKTRRASRRGFVASGDFIPEHSSHAEAASWAKQLGLVLQVELFGVTFSAPLAMAATPLPSLLLRDCFTGPG